MIRAFLGQAAVCAACALVAATGCASPDDEASYGAFGGNPKSDAAADSPGKTDGDAATSCDPGKAVCGTACVDLLADLSNCGACKNGCQIGQVCANGTCVVGCAPPKLQCNGVCADSLTDNKNCGACGTVCTSGTICSNGTCAASCGTGLTQCSGVCVNVQSDNQNCGACGAGCGAGQVCSQGACNLSCQVGLTNCQGTCVNQQTDNYNCGGCGIACGAGTACTGGTCVVTCPAGQVNCGGACANLQTDSKNCGGCTVACGVNQACSIGQCVTSCQSPLVQCGGGCVNVQNDPDNCGGCSAVCSSQNMASRTCGSGQCNGACAGGWGDCDGNKQTTGCEASLSTQSNCGGCGNSCAGNQTCQGGTCQSTCSNVNVAPLASPSISSGGNTDPYVPARANDGIMQTQVCDQWAWLDGGTGPSGSWFEYQWGSPVQVASIHMDTESSYALSACGNINRTLGGATIQWWNGGWVTDGQVAGMLDDWDYTLTAPVTTTRLRLYDVYATNGSYNPIVFEWQVFGCN